MVDKDQINDEIKDYPTVPKILAEIAGNWVGHKLQEAEDIENNDYLENNLYPIINKCIDINPFLPENYYRLGVIQCLKRQSKEAMNSFHMAKQFESLEMFSKRFHVKAQVDTALMFLDYENSEINLAMYVAQVSRAINIGGKNTKSELKIQYQESEFYKNLNMPSVQELKKSASISVINKLF